MTALTRNASFALIVAAAVTATATWRTTTARAAAPHLTAPLPAGFTEGAPGLKSAGALTFGPGGVLFVGDSRGGAVYALSIDDRTPDAHGGEVEIKDIDKRIAKLLGTTADQVLIRDMAVHPETRHLYFSVARGRGADAPPAIVRSTLTGELSEVPLATARFARLALANAPAETAKTPWGASARGMAITDLAFTDGELLIAGLSNEQFSSTLRRTKFPFDAAAKTTPIEIYHTSHGRYETAAPIETFLPFRVKGQPALLAGYGCAPLAVFEMASLDSAKLVRGRTLAELGGGNRPNDMVAIERNGERFVIIANSDRTLMRMKASDIDKSEALEKEGTRENPIFGTPYVALATVGVTQLEVLNAEHVILVQRDIDDGTLNVRSFPTKWL